MPYDRPIVLSIAGFDPTGGAGNLADIKTFEQHKCLGFSAMTAKTIQTEDHFISVDWFSQTEIMNQLKPLFAKHLISYVKIGIIENLEVLVEIIRWLKIENPEIKIVWDPVVSSSSGLMLLKEMKSELLQEIFAAVTLITPNIQEVILLAKIKEIMEAAEHLSQFCPVYLKGGHSITELGVDYLFHDDKKYKLSPTSTNYAAKHGSGCILSSAIICNLANGNILIEACENAKKYMEKILGSNNSLLAYHNV